MKFRLNSVATKLTAILLVLGGCILTIILLASTTFRHVERELPLAVHLGNINQAAIDLKTSAIQYLHSGSESSRASIAMLIARCDEAIERVQTGGRVEIAGDSFEFASINVPGFDNEIAALRMEWANLKIKIAAVVRMRESIVSLSDEMNMQKEAIKEEVYALSDRLETLGERFAPSVKLCDSLVTHQERIHGVVATLFTTELPRTAEAHRREIGEIAAVIDNILLWIRQGNEELNVPTLEDTQSLPLLSTLAATAKIKIASAERIGELWQSLIEILQRIRQDTATMLFMTHQASKELIAHHIGEIRGVENVAIRILVLAAAITLLAIVATYRYLIRPLAELSRATREIAAGRTDVVLTPRTSDEIGVLTTNFQKMAADLRMLHEQLIQASKLSSLGVMTAGIAHEINNPLAGIMGFAQLSLLQGNPDPAMKKRLETILELSERCKKIVQQLLQFSRQESHGFRPCRIDEILTATMAMLERQMTVVNIAVEKRFADNLPQVTGDPLQLQQIFVNIVNNAFDALLEVTDRPRKLTIETLLIHDMVRVAVADTGPGIAKEHLDRIFDPFFTTKEVGKGTGLGMSITYGIVKSHHGTIRIESEIGVGTSVIIDLPTAN